MYLSDIICMNLFETHCACGKHIFLVLFSKALCFFQENPDYKAHPYFVIRNVTPVIFVYTTRLINGILW